MIHRVYASVDRHAAAAAVLNSETDAILRETAHRENDPVLARSVYFSPTALPQIKRIFENGGTIVTDTGLAAEAIDRTAIAGRNITVKCFIEMNEVTRQAQLRRVTRAEVAADFALAEPGPKLLVYGSAPAGIQHIMCLRKLEPMNDICVLAGTTGFAGSIQLKEILAESDITSVVIRGKKGGISATMTLLNAILHQLARPVHF